MEPAQPPHILEVMYWLSQMGMAGVILVTAIFAYFQVEAIRRQSHASLLTELDKRWENDLAVARTVTRHHRAQAESIIKEKYAQSPAEEKRRLYLTISSQILDDLQTSDLDRYGEFLKVWGFFETLGHLVRRQYLTLDEVDSVFGLVVLHAVDMASEHLQKRAAEEQSKVGYDPHYYENFFYLAEEMRLANGLADRTSAHIKPFG